MMEYLTLEILGDLEKKPCHVARVAFKERFGTKAKIKDIITWLNGIEQKEWLAWILAQTSEITKAFIENGADVRTCDDEALRWTALYGHTEAAELLLKHGADACVRDDYALVWAAKRGHTEMVKLLLKNGANAHARDDFALHRATENNHTEIADLLRAHI
jgi:ankyrin repeat protein